MMFIVEALICIVIGVIIVVLVSKAIQGFTDDKID